MPERKRFFAVDPFPYSERIFNPSTRSVTTSTIWGQISWSTSSWFAVAVFGGPEYSQFSRLAAIDRDFDWNSIVGPMCCSRGIPIFTCTLKSSEFVSYLDSWSLGSSHTCRTRHIVHQSRRWHWREILSTCSLILRTWQNLTLGESRRGGRGRTPWAPSCPPSPRRKILFTWHTQISQIWGENTYQSLLPQEHPVLCYSET